MSLPMLPYPRSIFRPAVQTVFGGMNRNPGAGEGELYDMENLTGRDWPLLSARPSRALMYILSSVGSVGVLRGVGNYPIYFWTEDVAGTSRAALHFNRIDDQHITPSGLTLSRGQKRFAVMGNRIVVYPDGIVFTVESETSVKWERMKTSLSMSVRYQDGEIYGAPAVMNTIFAPGIGIGTKFHVGDGIEIEVSGWPAVSTSAVIREIPASGDELRFDDGAFSDLYYQVVYETENALEANHVFYFYRIGVLYYFNSGGTGIPARSVLESTGTGYYLSGVVANGRTFNLYHDVDAPSADWTELDFHPMQSTISREAPELEGIMANDNRLWGYEGSTIYASKLGDPLNFNVFDGLASDSWTLDAQVSGTFTGCAVYQGYPTFFTEDGIWRIYGDKPENFTLRREGNMGVLADSSRSIAEAGGTLFWLSPWGVCAWRGSGEPTLISGPLGETLTFESGAGGGDGTRYFISMRYYDTEDGDYVWGLYVYDTRRGMWHREDGTMAVEMVRDGNTVMWVTPRDGQNGWAVWSTLDLTGYAIFGDGWPLGYEGNREISWWAEFADSTRFYETTDTASQNKKGLLRLLLRCDLEEGSDMTVWVRYDSTGDWQEVRTVSAAKKQSFHFPLILRRCDHYRLKLTGTGWARIFSITAEKYSGSWKQTS